MRAVEVIQIVGTVFGATTTIVAAIGIQTVARFKRAGAVSAETAITVPDGRMMSRWWLERLRARGVVIVVDSGRMYLDDAQYRVFRTTRRNRGLTILGIVLVVVVVVLTVFH